MPWLIGGSELGLCLCCTGAYLEGSGHEVVVVVTWPAARSVEFG